VLDKTALERQPLLPPDLLAVQLVSRKQSLLVLEVVNAGVEDVDHWPGISKSGPREQDHRIAGRVTVAPRHGVCVCVSVSKRLYAPRAVCGVVSVVVSLLWELVSVKLLCDYITTYRRDILIASVHSRLVPPPAQRSLSGPAGREKECRRL